MPIRKDLRHFYDGPEWAAVRERILERAGHRCEQCGKPEHKFVHTYTWQTWCSQFPFGREKRYHMIWVEDGGSSWRDQNGEVLPPPGLVLRDGVWVRRIWVKLGVAHRDNNPSHISDDNLRAWCAWCHLHHDQPHHKTSRETRKDQSRPMLTVHFR